MSARLLAQACVALNNANKSNKRQVLIRNVNSTVIRFFTLMQAKGYIAEMNLIKDKRVQKLIINLTGRLNKCMAISPNYDLRKDEIEQFRASVLPARQFGHLILHTTKGMMDHTECTGKIGGKVLGYFF
ncbi:40S ribosomal protein S15/S22 [Pseudoloma neurophilia]|uniref:40S ribosomal protein S15/S22 n=1 Tax=Pseudoloma neurophilia TaxID=146866 RepID=A0A0R0LXU1_9MICR|nr:40S ribosomal protein S15/S22 [Pseudoloma neurophilia]